MIESALSHFWFLAVALAVAAAFSLHRFLRTGQRKWGAGVAVAACLVGALIVADLFIETPAQQVAAELDRIVAAAMKQDAEEIVDAISPAYDHDGITYQQIAGLIRQRFSEYEPDSLRFNGLSIETDGPEAVARFVAATSGKYRGYGVNRYLIRLALTFRKEGERWKIVAVDRFELAGDTRKKIPITRL